MVLEKSTDLETKNESNIVAVSEGFDSGDSESTDDTVNTSELPELIEIENPDEAKPKEKLEPEQTTDETPALPGMTVLSYLVENTQEYSEWEDILGTGRLHIKRISPGSGEQINRTSSIKIQISTPSVPFDIKFGSSECELKVHSTLEVIFHFFE